jgi:hypothetical protein
MSLILNYLRHQLARSYKDSQRREKKKEKQQKTTPKSQAEHASLIQVKPGHGKPGPTSPA